MVVSLVGVPLLLGGLALGRTTQRESAAAFEALAPASRWRHLGWLGVIVAGLILSYYGVIAGWVLKYLWVHGSGSPTAAMWIRIDAFRALLLPSPSATASSR